MDLTNYFIYKYFDITKNADVKLESLESFFELINKAYENGYIDKTNPHFFNLQYWVCQELEHLLKKNNKRKKALQ